MYLIFSPELSFVLWLLTSGHFFLYRRGNMIICAYLNPNNRQRSPPRLL